MRARRVILISSLLVVGMVLPAAAETFTVKLQSGNTFITRYQPRQASWDPDVVLVMSDVGNWIALESKDIESVTSDTETRGFGIRLTSNTLLLGYSANDAEEAKEGGGTNSVGDLLNKLDQINNSRSYDQKQFVDPSDAGGGIPLGTQSFSFFSTTGGTAGGGAEPGTVSTVPINDGGSVQ